MTKLFVAGALSFALLYTTGAYFVIHYAMQLLANACIDAAWGY